MLSHVSIVLTLVEKEHFIPLLANVFAYLFALQISFFGHRYWTFEDHGAIRDSFYRFFLIACLGLILNEGLYFLFYKKFHLYYPLALLIVLAIVPVFTFIGSKIWVFQSQERL